MRLKKLQAVLGWSKRRVACDTVWTERCLSDGGGGQAGARVDEEQITARKKKKALG